MVEVWVKVYAVEVEVEWMDDLSMENPILSARQHSLVRPIPLPCHDSKELQSTGYILDLISLDP